MTSGKRMNAGMGIKVITPQKTNVKVIGPATDKKGLIGFSFLDHYVEKQVTPCDMLRSSPESRLPWWA